MDPLAEALTRLQAAYPRQPFGDVAVRVYAEQLSDLDGQDVLDAARRLINTSVYFPTIADLRRDVAEHALGLPTPDVAWSMALAGDSQGIDAVRESIKAVGGPWVIRNSTNPETLRAQFWKDYETRRARFIRNAAVGKDIDAAQLTRIRREVTNGGVVSLNGKRVAQIPQSTRIHPRPVMMRLAIRMAGRIVPPPTDEEKHDAILILAADRQGDEDVLYAEAERVLHDA